MQLKTVGESLTVLESFDNIFNKGMDYADEFKQLQEALKACSIDSVKLAISQRDLKESQIKTALSAAGLEGETLKTTTAELTQVVADKQLAKSKAEAAGSTTVLGTAMKGLVVKIKEATIAIGKFLLTNPLGWITMLGAAIAGLIVTWDDHKKAIQKQRTELKSS